MWEDPVVEAVRKVRDAHAAQFDYDLQGKYQRYPNTFLTST